jgi:hypothetical protein
MQNIRLAGTGQVYAPLSTGSPTMYSLCADTEMVRELPLPIWPTA